MVIKDRSRETERRRNWLSEEDGDGDGECEPTEDEKPARQDASGRLPPPDSVSLPPPPHCHSPQSGSSSSSIKFDRYSFNFLILFSNFS